MSAIWGIHSSNELITEESISLMKSTYESRTKIDRYASQTVDKYHAGCGIQYITNESVREPLPIYDKASGIIFNADCILDNRGTLINELSLDYSLTDGEIMYEAYKNWGIDCVKHFIGLFSLAVYDTNTETLYLAVDPCASRCLHYYMKDGKTIYSTIPAAIRAIEADIKINDFYLYDYILAPGMMPNLSATETAFEGILHVEPGTYISIQNGKKAITKYFSLDNNYPALKSYKFSKSKNPKVVKEEFVNTFTECVNSALRTTDNVAISLSSGFDSASVGAVASDLLAKSNNNLYAYTYVPFFKPEKRKKNFVEDETEDVLKIVEMHPNILPHFLCNEGKNAYEYIDSLLETLEVPIKAYRNLPNLCEIYSNAYNDNCRILLTGQYGNSTISFGNIDDILYDYYKKHRYIKFMTCLNSYCLLSGESRKLALLGCVRYFNYSIKANRDPQSTPSYYDCDNKYVSSNYKELLPSRYDFGSRMVASGIKCIASTPSCNEEHYNDLERTAPYCFIGDYETKLGLKYGIVIRDPARDIRIIKFCAQLVYEMFAYKGTPRWLIRGCLNDLLPQNILSNVNRYGVQNFDATKRLERDKSALIPQMLDTLTHYSSADLLDIDSIINSLNDSSFNFLEHNLAADQLIFILTYIKFKTAFE